MQYFGEPPVLPNKATVPLTPGVGVGGAGLIFVSGQLGFDSSGALRSDDIAAQTAQALENIKRVLELAGSDLSKVAKITGWLVRPQDFGEFNRVYADYFPENPPARSMVVSALLVPGALVELEAVATT